MRHERQSLDQVLSGESMLRLVDSRLRESLGDHGWMFPAQSTTRDPVTGSNSEKGGHADG